MEATYSSETSVDFQQTTWRYILEDITLHNYSFEDIKSYEIKYTISNTDMYFLQTNEIRDLKYYPSSEIFQVPVLRAQNIEV
jgi:hypothetical protein